MIFSKPTSYAVRALVHLAQNRNKGAILATDIATAETLPAPFLSKLLRELSANNVVMAVRGPGGGFLLNKDPAEISLYDVFMLYDGLTLSNECLLGHGACSDETACCVHMHWKPTKRIVEEFLKATTIADLVQMREDKRRNLLDS
jgi:Rrf2 family iron-sulfur cluster assembly transcriptional regulator